MSELRLVSPLSGWCASLTEVPDEVFAGGMLGQGVAIDPIDALLRAPCEGVVAAIPVSAHAITLRTGSGVEILLHIGIDTVALKGAGFQALVRAGERVRQGQPLIRFDLDLLARQAKSLLSPVVLTEAAGCTIVERHTEVRIAAGEPLLTLRAPADAAVRPTEAHGTAGGIVRQFVVDLPHGLHARPAALIAAGLKPLRGEFALSLRGRTADAQSAVAIMALGAQAGDRVEFRGTGADAVLAGDALGRALGRALQLAAQATVAPLSQSPDGPVLPGAIPGLRAAGGLAVGTSIRISGTEATVPEAGAGPARELQALDRARARLQRTLTQRMAAGTGLQGEVTAAHLEFLDDPQLLAAAHAHIAKGRSAGFAWRAAIRDAIGELLALGDAHLAARADDLRDLELQVLEALGVPLKTGATVLPDHAIVLAQSLLPSQLLSLDPARLAGICTANASDTSHVALLAQSMDLPMLTGVDAGALAIADGTTLLLDADAGLMIRDPDSAAIADAEQRIARRQRERARLRDAAGAPCCTADGVRIEVLANVSSMAEAAVAVKSGADGCGLLRTELLFLDRAEPPSLEEQARAYQAIADAFGDRPVVVRTLDAGGDKAMPFLPMPPEDNPALGLRGIRAGLRRPELLRTQLAAIRALRPPGRCRILLPMVSDVAEIRAVRSLLEESGGVPAPALGIMIETPAAALNARQLAPHADFFSIGTNDLAQYALAIDRTHPVLAAGLDALHPAVLRLIGLACDAARDAGRPLSVCGGLAADPLGVAVLLGLGVTAVSVPPAAIPGIKDAVRRLTLTRCRELAARALALDSAADVRRTLAS